MKLKIKCLLLTIIQEYLWIHRQIFKKILYSNIIFPHHLSAEDNRNIPKIRSKDAFSHINKFKTKIFFKFENHPTHMVTNSSDTEG